MKIVFINTLYSPNLVGGAERVVQSLAEAVISAGHQAVVVSIAPDKVSAVGCNNGVTTYYLALKNLYWPYAEEPPLTLKPLWHAIDTYNLWMAHEIKDILDAEQPNLVHTHNLVGFSTLAWKAVKQLHVPVVHTLHDYYLICPRSTMYRKGKACNTQCIGCRPYALARRRLGTHVDAVVGVSKFILERHLKFGYFATTPHRRVIYNPMLVESAAPSSRTASLPIRFGYLGRLHPTKGIEVLLESVKQLPKGTWSLDIGGKGLCDYESYLHDKY